MEGRCRISRCVLLTLSRIDLSMVRAMMIETGGHKRTCNRAVAIWFKTNNDEQNDKIKCMLAERQVG